MAYPTPESARVVALVSDVAMRARIVFLAGDGRIDDAEQVVLDGLEEVSDLAMECDDGRKLAIAFLNGQDISDWHRRQWRERTERRQRPPAA